MSAEVGAFFGWLIRASWQATVLAALVLAVQWAFQKKLSARWRYALWLLVLARLMLPIAPQSGLSVFNYAPLGRAWFGLAHFQETKAVYVAPKEAEPPQRSTGVVKSNGADESARPAAVSPPEALAGIEKTQPSAPKARKGFFISPRKLAEFGAILWLMGVLLVAVRIIGQNVVFARGLQAEIEIKDEGILELFEQCKGRFSIRCPIRLLATERITTPALYGCWPATLLLPAKILPHFTRDELRYVFLHELGHVKRHDMTIHWVATILRVAHWF